MRIWGQRLQWLLLGCSFALGGSSLSAQAPFLTVSAKEEVRVKRELEQKIHTANMALQAGVKSLAARLYGEALLELKPEDPRREGVRLSHVTALLALGKIEEAQQQMAAASSGDQPSWLLRKAMIALASKESQVLSRLLGQINVEALPQVDKSWYHYVKGHWQCNTGEFAEGLKQLEQAVALAVNEAQKADMEMAVYQRRVFAGVVSSELLKDLKSKTESFKGQKSGFRFAREYAIALYKTDQQSEALEVVESQLKLLEFGPERDGFLLLMGMFSEAASGRGILALQELIRNGTDSDLQSLGLYLLVQVWSTSGNAKPEEHMPFLQEILKSKPDHSLREEFLMLLAHLAFENGQYDIARETAETFLESFPQSERLNGVLRLLAGVSILGKPPQYRTAASHLARLRDMANTDEARFAFGVQMADSLFLAGDYESAAKLYETIVAEADDQPGGGIHAYQWILALIEAGNLDRAQAELSNLGASIKAFGEHRWRVEWNLISKMQRDGRVEEAFARVREVLKDNAGVLPQALILRFRWLEVYLSMRVQGAVEVIGLADSLIDLLNTQEPELVEKLDISALKASTLLLKIQALLQEKQIDQATPLIEQLRTQFSESEPAQRSYLLEAGYHFQMDDLVKAQQLSVMLADNFPENPLSPIALMQAAQYAEKRGSDAFFQESIKLLERLSNQYPNHELFFFAKLRQGHLFRKLNQFGNAQQIYSNLINQHPEHAMIHLALLANADCFLARMGEDAGNSDIAVNLLERLFLQPDLPADVVVEAGYKLAFAHKQSGREKQAQEVLGGVLDQFLLNPSGQTQPLNGNGRYWMSRSILELGGMLEEAKSQDEARIVYGLIEENNLPGRSLANARIEQLGI